MNTSAIAFAVLATTLGASTLAFADDDFRGGRHGDRSDQRADRTDRHDRSDRWERRDDRREARREDRQDARRDWQRDQRAYVAPAPQYRTYAQPGYRYNQPNYGYSSPNYAYQGGPRWSRGGYLPHEYRQAGYYVTNWNSYPGLYAPPYGHQWVNVDGDFLLVAITTGLIANLLLH